MAMGLKKSWNLLKIYDLMIIALLVLTAYNLYTSGLSPVMSIISLVLTACVIDSVINYIREKRLFFPKSALITALILGLIVQASVLFLVIIAAVAILSKHVIKIKGRHVFNPANFSLFVALFLPVSESWWGMSNSLLVAVFGLIIVYKLKRYHQVLPFIAINAALMLFILSGSAVADHVTSGLLLFFVFYMLIEPVTSPVQKKSRIIFGALVSVFAAILYVVWLPGAFVGSLFLADIFVPVLDRVFGPKIVKETSIAPTMPSQTSTSV